MDFANVLFAKQFAKQNGGGNADLSDYYTKSQTDSLIAEKADKSSTYTKTETDNLLDNKVNNESGKGLSSNDFTDEYKNKVDISAPQSTTYTKTETNQMITLVQEQINNITDQVFGAGKVIPNGADLNNYTTTGVYNCLNRASSETLINNPYKLRGFRLEVVQTTAASTSFITQRLYPNAGEDGVFFLRRWDGVGVGNWYKFVGEAVTTT